jgi:hypothetical protein
MIDAEIAADPESAQAEYLSIWRDDLSSYCTRQEIEACILDGMTIRPPQPGVQYVSRIDASSGLGKDSMTACIGHMEGDISVIDCVTEIVPPFAPPDAVAQIANILKSYSITRTMGDRWGLNFVAAEFQRHGIALGYSDKNRSDIYREALPIIRSRRARLLANERMINQFVNLERRALPGGNERIDHPQRGNHHDDVCQVVSAVLVALGTPSNAENWIEYYRRLSEASGPAFSRIGVDMDEIRVAGPQFGWNLTSEPLVQVRVPQPIAAEGRITIKGTLYGFRRIGLDVIAEVRREDAAWLLSRSTVWRDLNRVLAAELLGEKAE